MDSLERIALDVALDKGDVFYPSGFSIFAAELKERIAAIEGKNRARRTNTLGEQNRRVAKTATTSDHLPDVRVRG